jgi:hypothetical protein
MKTRGDEIDRLKRAAAVFPSAVFPSKAPGLSRYRRAARPEAGPRSPSGTRAPSGPEAPPPAGTSCRNSFGVQSPASCHDGECHLHSGKDHVGKDKAEGFVKEKTSASPASSPGFAPISAYPSPWGSPRRRRYASEAASVLRPHRPDAAPVLQYQMAPSRPGAASHAGRTLRRRRAALRVGHEPLALLPRVCASPEPRPHAASPPPPP